MTPPRYDCLCAGIVVADHLCEPIENVPEAGQLVLTNRTSLSIGGCAANVALTLAKLRHTPAVVGCVGDDFFGTFLTQSLQQAGVNCRYLARAAGEATSCSMIVNVTGQDRRFIHARGANRILTGKEISGDLLDRSRVLYVGGYCLSAQPSPKNVAALFQAARARGVRTVLDVVIPERGQDYWPFLEPVLPWADVFLPNNDEAYIITHSSDPVEQARRFRSAGAATVVITCGRDGCILADQNTFLRCGRFPIDYLDGTGSGDAFAAGYIHGLLMGTDAETCVRYGSALGASCVRAIGATTGVFNAAELTAFLDSQPLEMTPI
jgi:sugar/nucleoside kinase (ribokinase family)